MKEILRHYFNPLHVYCRLKSCGMSNTTARNLCEIYERLYSRIL
ncbi:conserved protein of unknown function [Maridesulfovibrio hydrothermalis AM13 = DSM 14728]|uniref:Transposase n=2 Tax=Maridesulfovibrio TaxID=2794998 RepID=L0RI01_9BACT|nr:conserved protein of unknown function [Maridesulfovibrio hydrothermalis AM13 = DSM 14728]